MQLWDYPNDGVDPEDDDDAPWNWTELKRYHYGPTNTPPNGTPGWERWYFLYETPDGEKVKISADRDPQTGRWFNPHRSSSQQWP